MIFNRRPIIWLKIAIANVVLKIIYAAIKILGRGPAAYLAERLVLTEQVPISGGYLNFVTGNSTLLFRALSVLTKEPETIAWIDSFQDHCCFWDIGANVGVYSLYAARRRNAKVLAFEPGAANYQVLNRNIELNDSGSSIKAFCLAFSDKLQLGTLNLTNTIAGGAANNFDVQGVLSPYASRATKPFNQGMIGISIDEFIAMFAPVFPEYMKIDVDGIEELILIGAKATLADSRLLSVLIELDITDEAGYRRCIEILEASGLKLTERGLRQDFRSSVGPVNHIFVRKNN